MARQLTGFISENDCIGDSLDSPGGINPNFLALDEAVQSLSAYDSSLKAAITPSGSNISVIGNVSVNNNLSVGNVLSVTGNLSASGGNVKLTTGRITRQIITQVNSSGFSTGTAWALGPAFDNIPGFKGGSLVKLFYHIPCRNDTTSWGGCYIEPQISFNGGSSYFSLGSCGHDGGVMKLGNFAVGSYSNTLLINPNITTDFSVRVRFYFRSFDGTAQINQNISINTVSGTATLGLMSGINSTQHFSKIVVEELY